MTKFLNKVKSNKLLMKLSSVLIIFVVLCSMLVVPSAASDEDPREALVGKTFYFNETLTDLGDFSLNDSRLYIEFISGDFSYTDLKRYSGSGIYLAFVRSVDGYQHNDKVYNYSDSSLPLGWQSSSSRLVTVTGYHGALKEGWLSWFLDNTLTLLSFSVNGSSFSFFEDSTWSSFVDSDLNSGSFTISGDSVFYDGYRLDGVKASDLIQADRNYSFPPSASYFMTAEGILDWVMAAITDSLKIFYVEGQGLTLVGVLGVVSVSISIAFLLISVISNFLKNRG